MTIKPRCYNIAHALNRIRATYTTYGEPLSPEFFDFGKPVTDPNVPVWHIPVKDLIPSLLPAELERVDNLIAQSPWSQPPPASLRKAVLGRKEDRPEVNTWTYANTKTGAHCGECGKMGDNKMPMCSRYVCCPIQRFVPPADSNARVQMQACSLLQQRLVSRSSFAHVHC